MHPFVAKELERLKARWDNLSFEAAGRWSFTGWRLPPGWNMTQSQLWVPCPPAYPQTPPDNFYTDAQLRLADGREPGNSSLTHLENGLQVRCFSFHVQGGWDPEQGDALESFLFGVERRLSEPT